MLKFSTIAAREVVGAAICLVAIGVTVLIWRGSPEPPSALPLVFLVIVVWVAVQFGRHAGFASTVIAAAALAFFVYKPIHHFAVSDKQAASYIAALIFGGLICSELLADHPGHRHIEK
jgi:K+-sensing histidine kinase KdpD